MKKERQRWRPEEDAVLRAYVRQFGAREWHLVSQRMNCALDRDAKSCLERWKNYLRPGIKKGSLTDDEQRLVIRLQAKHGNKWKKIAAEVPGRTAKRLGKWWEVFKEKQLRAAAAAAPAATTSPASSSDQSKYDLLLESFAEKLMSTTPFLPPWLSPPPVAPPSVTLSLSTSAPAPANGMMEVVECCRELEEGYRAYAAHRKEAAWRLRRVELQLESEKAGKRRETMEEFEAKMRALREEQHRALERVEAEYREQLQTLRRDAEAKEQKLAEQWAAKHARLSKCVEQMGYRQWPPAAAAAAPAPGETIRR